MGRPEGLIKSKIKNNDNKHPQRHAEWMAGKKIGRPKQRWVWDINVAGQEPVGHWEKA